MTLLTFSLVVYIYKLNSLYILLEWQHEYFISFFPSLNLYSIIGCSSLGISLNKSHIQDPKNRQSIPQHKFVADRIAKRMALMIWRTTHDLFIGILCSFFLHKDKGLTRDTSHMPTQAKLDNHLSISMRELKLCYVSTCKQTARCIICIKINYWKERNKEKKPCISILFQFSQIVKCPLWICH